MAFIAKKTSDGKIKGKISFYCHALNVTRQGFYKYLGSRNKPWKYQAIADAMHEIIEMDEYNDCYGSIRMYEALNYYQSSTLHIPSERTIYRIMQRIGLSKKVKRKPNGLTKSDKEAMKSEDRIKRDFTANAPFAKCVTDITEVKTKDGKLYVSAIFDCYDSSVLGISIKNHMKAELCAETVKNAYINHPEIKHATIHSDRGSQYTSALYNKALKQYAITQSMNSAGGPSP